MERSPKQLHREDVAIHVRVLQEQANFRGSIEKQGPQGPPPSEDSVPEGLIFYPGETSPRSPPDIPVQRLDQESPEAAYLPEGNRSDQRTKPDRYRRLRDSLATAGVYNCNLPSLKDFLVTLYPDRKSRSKSQPAREQPEPEDIP